MPKKKAANGRKSERKKTAKKPAASRKKAAKRPAKKTSRKSPKKTTRPKKKTPAVPDPPPVPPPAFVPPPIPTRDEREQNRKAEFASARRSAAADIGGIPPIEPEYQELREECERDIVLWHTHVFKNSTGIKPFSKYQVESIETSRLAIEGGGLTNILEPRGGGKSTRAIQNSIWALCYGRRRFAGIAGSSTDKTDELVDGIRVEVETNDVLLEMFPEVFYPLRCLGGKPQKAKSQHIGGKPTNVVYESSKIVFPTVEGSAASGAILAVKPIRNVRGLQHRTESKGVIRPDLWLLDDVQTDEGAKSKKIVRKILNLIRKSILFGGSYAGSLAVLNLATIIEPWDVPDQLASDLAWVTVRYSFLLKEPKQKELWLNDYARIRRDYVVDRNPVKTRANKENAEAKARNFYLANRQAMEAGAETYWEWAWPWKDKAHHDGLQLCLSSLQHYYNVLIDHGEDVAACELQNRPIKVNLESMETSKASKSDLRSSIVSIPRGVVPLEHNRLVTYVDTHQNLYYFVTVSKDLATNSRHVVDYGTWPQQQDLHFTLETANKTIPDQNAYKGLGPKAMVAKSLTDFLDDFFKSRHYKSQTGNRFDVDEVRIDANWGPMEATIKRVIRNHAQRARLWASHGIGLGASKAPMNDWKRQPGEQKGDGWTKKKQTAKAVQTLLIDTNQWKTETHNALKSPHETSGGMSIFEADSYFHDLFFEHVLTEDCKRKQGRRDCEEWSNPPGGQNHYFDCLVGATADGDGHKPEPAAGSARRNTFDFQGFGF